MDAATVKALLQDHLPDCEFHVQGEGSNYDIVAVGAVFDGLRPVKKQQLVYGTAFSVIICFLFYTSFIIATFYTNTGYFSVIICSCFSFYTSFVTIFLLAFIVLLPLYL